MQQDPEVAKGAKIPKAGCGGSGVGPDARDDVRWSLKVVFFRRVPVNLFNSQKKYSTAKFMKHIKKFFIGSEKTCHISNDDRMRRPTFGSNYS